MDGDDDDDEEDDDDSGCDWVGSGGICGGGIVMSAMRFFGLTAGTTVSVGFFTACELSLLLGDASFGGEQVVVVVAFVVFVAVGVVGDASFSSVDGGQGVDAVSDVFVVSDVSVVFCGLALDGCTTGGGSMASTSSSSSSSASTGWSSSPSPVKSIVASGISVVGVFSGVISGACGIVSTSLPSVVSMISTTLASSDLSVAFEVVADSTEAVSVVSVVTVVVSLVASEAVKGFGLSSLAGGEVAEVALSPVEFLSGDAPSAEADASPGVFFFSSSSTFACSFV